MSPATPAGAAEFVLVGVNPFAAAQPTPRGRALHVLRGWRGELYTGYGDYDANTGPVEVTAYSPRDGTFSSKLRFASEAIEVYRPLGDRLYAPAIDPREGLPLAAVAIGEADGRWWSNGSVELTHAFDVASLDGADLWLVGSLDWEAVAMRSTDGGATWTRALSIPRHSARSRDFARFYFTFVHRGKLYVQGEDYIAGLHPRSLIFDGSRWTDGPDLYPVRGGRVSGTAFLGSIVYRGRFSLMVFDGTRARGTTVYASDLTVGDGVLYALVEGTVRRTTDLERWETVAAAPAGTVSIGLLDGVLYAGTASSQLYRLRGP